MTYLVEKDVRISRILSLIENRKRYFNLLVLKRFEKPVFCSNLEILF